MRLPVLLCLNLLLAGGSACGQLVAERTDYLLDQSSAKAGEAFTPFHFDALSVNFPGNWKFGVSQQSFSNAVISGTGPNRENVTIIVGGIRWQGRENTAKENEDYVESSLPPATRAILTSAEKYGPAVRPMKETTSAQGNLVRAMAYETSLLFSSYYLAAYVLASRSLGTTATIRFEGGGKASEVLERFDKIVGTHRWGWNLYPDQARVFTDPPFDRPDLRATVRPANPDEVKDAWGLDFASLPQLGAVLILAVNKTRETPITVSRQSVRLTLPDAQVLKPLEPSEMVEWLGETYGAASGKTARDAVFGHQADESRLEYEKGVLAVSRGKPRGTVLSFRFPAGITSGEFPVTYTLDLGADGQLPVRQTVSLNLQPAGRASTQAAPPPAPGEPSESWRRDTDAFARLVLGEDRRPRPPSGKTDEVPVAASTLQQVIGARVNWPMSALQVAGTRFPAVPIVIDGQEVGLLGSPRTAATDMPPVDSALMVSGKIDKLVVAYLPSGKIYISVTLVEFDARRRN